MTRLVAILRRVPKPLLFSTAALIQVALIGYMVVDRVMILRTGTEVKLEARPVDPRDFLRGDYVTLNYNISSVPGGDILESATTGMPVFVKLAPNRDGFYETVSVHTAPVDVTSPDVLIRGRIRGGIIYYRGKAACPNGCTLQVQYGIERYFVPEGEGGKIEAARNARKLAVVAAVTPAGRAAIKRLLIDGEPVYDEPWF
jgi:uncharacterized membrane-anchored protein